MESTTINIFDPSALTKLINDLEQMKKDFEDGKETLLNRLSDVAIGTAEMHYASGFIDDNTDVVVTSQPIKNGRKIIASGKDVCFLEFGTGVAAGNGYDTSVIEPPVDISPKSWSESKGTKEFARFGSWHHNGKKYTMTTPRMGMYHARLEVERQTPQIAKEVFGL